MATTKAPQTAANKTAANKTNRGFNMVSVMLSTVIAAGAAVGGTYFGAHHGPAQATELPAPPPPLPGYTLALAPFMVITRDAERGNHPMRVVLNIEFTEATTEASVTPLLLRIRDTVLTQLRELSYEDAANPRHMADLRQSLATHVTEAGVRGVARVLVTDFVVQ